MVLEHRCLSATGFGLLPKVILIMKTKKHHWIFNNHLKRVWMQFSLWEESRTHCRCSKSITGTALVMASPQPDLNIIEAEQSNQYPQKNFDCPSRSLVEIHLYGSVFVWVFFFAGLVDSYLVANEQMVMKSLKEKVRKWWGQLMTCTDKALDCYVPYSYLVIKHSKQREAEWTECRCRRLPCFPLLGCTQ